VTSDFTEVLRENLEVAARMHHHLERSRQQIAGDVPLQPEQISQLDDAQIDRLDLYLARLSKLQDFITSKLFRSVALASLEDTSQDVSLIDALRRMEKYDIIHDFDEWLGIRLLRNSFTHEYLTDEATIAENINTAFSAYEILSETLVGVRQYYEMHIIQGGKG